MAYSDKEKQREYQRKWQQARRAAVKAAVIEYMGGKCIKCEVEDIRVLQLDHITPILRDGKTTEDFNSNSYKAIYNNPSLSSKFQLLCANCHMIKTIEVDSKLFKRSYKNEVYYFNPKVHQVKPII